MKRDQRNNKSFLRINQAYTKAQNISMKFLSEEFKPIALDIDQFENRRTNNINWTFLYVQLINNAIWGSQLEFFYSRKH